MTRPCTSPGSLTCLPPPILWTTQSGNPCLSTVVATARALGLESSRLKKVESQMPAILAEVQNYGLKLVCHFSRSKKPLQLHRNKRLHHRKTRTSTYCQCCKFYLPEVTTLTSTTTSKTTRFLTLSLTLICFLFPNTGFDIHPFLGRYLYPIPDP